MQFRQFPLIALLFLPLVSAAQSIRSIPLEIYGGYSYLSNSFNGVPGSRQPLNGFVASAGMPPWRFVRFKLDFSNYTGTNIGASQHAYFIVGGAQFEKIVHRERFYAQGLVGDGGLNRDWGAKAIPGGTASFAADLGGGLDTPIGSHFGIRVEGDMQHTNFDLIKTLKDPVPYSIPGLPRYFGRVTAGIVWTPKIAHSGSVVSPRN
jgi:hypothetical protein